LWIVEERGQSAPVHASAPVRARERITETSPLLTRRAKDLVFDEGTVEMN
jgi:hypothetical protein